MRKIAPWIIVAFVTCCVLYSHAVDAVRDRPAALCDTDTDCMNKFGGDGGPGR